MRYDLAAMARRQGLKRKRVVLPAIGGTKAQSDELARILLRVVAVWNDAARGPILAAYSEALAAQPMDAMTRDDAPRAASTISAADGEASRLTLVLTPALRDWAVRIERFVRCRFAAGVLSATGVNLDTVIGPGDARAPLDTWVERNVALVRDVSDQARGRISDIVFRGLSRRTPARDVAREMNEAVALGRARSLRIASDQLSKLTTQLAAERRRQAGLDQWEWLASGKVNGREEHAALDGKVFSDKDPPEDMPGELPNCGCRARAVLDLDR
ncbi:phage minor head protein [Sandarakinorhabdus sp. DWP1-3-1]|uniref:phage minor head protein n=1 Tax=Sandarakinorhabdus sp. DWP1-3-1 TaxID=2804627 RepID=UPI003CF5B7A3